MTNQLHFLAGLPRSGANLLGNLLAQNPRFHTTSCGGILSTLGSVRVEWNKQRGFLAAPDAPAKLRVLRGMIDGYYAGVRQPVIIDRSLGWLGSIEMAEAILERPARFLVCVRDLRDVLATFELQWRNFPQMRQLIAQRPDAAHWETLAGRCDVWVKGEEAVGFPYNQIRDALTRGYGDRLHFIPLEKLTRSPRETLARIYQFLGEPVFAHDLGNIRQVCWDDYAYYGVSERTDLPPFIPVIDPLWPEVLGPVADRYANHQLW